MQLLKGARRYNAYRKAKWSNDGCYQCQGKVYRIDKKQKYLGRAAYGALFLFIFLQVVFEISFSKQYLGSLKQVALAAIISLVYAYIIEYFFMKASDQCEVTDEK